jgi:hypothetical protein
MRFSLNEAPLGLFKFISVNSIIDQLSSNLQNSVIIIRDSDMANNKYEQNQFKGDSNVQFILKDFKTIKD